MFGVVVLHVCSQRSTWMEGVRGAGMMRQEWVSVVEPRIFLHGRDFVPPSLTSAVASACSDARSTIMIRSGRVFSATARA